MKVKSKRETLHPPEESLQLIEACAKELSPDEDTLLAWHARKVTIQKRRLALDLEIVSDNVSVNRRILELGSIPLVLTTALSRRDYDVVGCDIAPERYAASIERTGLKVVKCNIETEKLPFADNAFDATVFNEIFEHLPLPPLRREERIEKRGVWIHDDSHMIATDLPTMNVTGV